MIWSRDIIHIGNGVVYINFPGDENKAENECAMFIKSEDYGLTWKINDDILGDGNKAENECAMFIKSEDYGETWKITDDILGAGNEKINAVYRSITHVDGTILAGAQNYARILRLE